LGTNNQKTKTMKKPKKKGNIYFSGIHEEAIVKYAKSTDLNEKTKLYITLIEPAFGEMVDKIIFTYKFTSLPNVEDLRKECKIWLTTILDKFDVEKGSKAFSYFSVITKNFFIHAVKRNAKESKSELVFEELDKDLEHKYFSTENPYFVQREAEEFWRALFSEIDLWLSEDYFKDCERRVLEAIKILFQSSQEISIFNKKAIYLFLREITGFPTKQIVFSLNKIREKYRNFRNIYNNQI
jgi:hypothetical protein